MKAARPPSWRVIRLGRADHWWLADEEPARIACGATGGSVATEDRKVSCVRCLKMMLRAKRRRK